jgi:uncharacterized membrane protein (UPF0127 family)
VRPSVAFLTLLFTSLLLVTGCSGGENESAATNPAGTTESTTLDSTTITVTSSDGTRTQIEAEIADNDTERQRGLMERTALAEDAGMLFVFDRDQILSFWMKNTLIPLSVAYIASDGSIVDVQDMQPLDTTPHPSARPARYALEVNQGFFGEHGIAVGDQVELPELGGNSS